jgi:5-methyltetrahydrofolate--homocysteine methyltransferase
MVSLEEISNMIIDLDMESIARGVQEQLDAGTNPHDILNALTKGMDEVGRRYETNEYFLTELVLAGETMKEAFTILQPHLSSDEKGERIPIILATVKGDNHDIGKNILSTMLVSAGFNVIDLGTDCPEDKIVNAVKENNAKVIALSSLLTMTMQEIATVNKALEEAGLRDDVKLIVGGAPLSMKLAKELGADDYGADAIEGVRRIKALLQD